MHVYRLRNKKTGAFLKRINGKTIWHTTGAAKNAWNAQFRNTWDRVKRHYITGPKFSEQSEWECVEFRLLEVFR